MCTVVITIPMTDEKMGYRVVGIRLLVLIVNDDKRWIMIVVRYWYRTDGRTAEVKTLFLEFRHRIILRYSIRNAEAIKQLHYGMCVVKVVIAIEMKYQPLTTNCNLCVKNCYKSESTAVDDANNIINTTRKFPYRIKKN